MKLLKIEKIEKQDEYWDIEVEDNSNFYANGLLVHNSNAGYVFTKCYQYYQSRENIITPVKDNMSCAFMMQTRKDIFNELCESILKYYNFDDSRYGVVLYMELCGRGIQKGVSVSELEKKFILFEYSLIIDLETFEKVSWVKTNIF